MMTTKKKNVWTTADGRNIEIEWMDSVHLIHALNLLMRKVGVGISKPSIPKALISSSVYQEAAFRQLLVFAPTLTEEGYKQFAIPNKRESAMELAILNAQRELLSGPPFFDLETLERSIREGSAQAQEIMVKAVALRLTR